MGFGSAPRFSALERRGRSVSLRRFGFGSDSIIFTVEARSDLGFFAKFLGLWNHLRNLVETSWSLNLELLGSFLISHSNLTLDA